MKILPLKKYPNKVLSKKNLIVEKITPDELKLLNDMAATMYASYGIGLAAPQIGVNKQLAVIDVGNGLIKLINPVIIKKIGRDCMEEGCLSLPSGFQVKVTRAKEVHAKYLNEYGEQIFVKASGLLAKAIQHEVDHLMGILIIDKVNPVKKIFIINKLSKT